MNEKEYFLPKNVGFEKEIAKRLEWWNKLKEQEQSAKKKDEK